MVPDTAKAAGKHLLNRDGRDLPKDLSQAPSESRQRPRRRSIACLEDETSLYVHALWPLAYFLYRADCLRICATKWIRHRNILRHFRLLSVHLYKGLRLHSPQPRPDLLGSCCRQRLRLPVSPLPWLDIQAQGCEEPDTGDASDTGSHWLNLRVNIIDPSNSFLG